MTVHFNIWGRMTPLGWIAVLLLGVGLIGCTDGPRSAVGRMSLEGEPGTAVQAAHRAQGTTAPRGVELANAEIAITGEDFSAVLVPRGDVWEAATSGALGTLPMWSVALWNDGEGDENLPTYWIIATTSLDEEGRPLEPSQPPTELALWVCGRDDLPEDASTVIPLPSEASGAPAPRCGRQPGSAEGRLTERRVEVEVSRGELAELDDAFFWAVAASGATDVRQPGWVHCIPTCADGDWRFPPREARAPFPAPE